MQGYKTLHLTWAEGSDIRWNVLVYFPLCFNELEKGIRQDDSIQRFKFTSLGNNKVVGGHTNGFDVAHE